MHFAWRKLLHSGLNDQSSWFEKMQLQANKHHPWKMINLIYDDHNFMISILGRGEHFRVTNRKHTLKAFDHFQQE